MTEKNQTEREGASRQVDLLIKALEDARENGGVWLNPKRKTKPLFYGNEVTMSAFNSVILALHSDQNGYKTNQYTLFSEAKKRGESVREHERGVPYSWYSIKEYQNLLNPDQLITRDSYMKMSEEEKKEFRAVKNREIRILFNIDQTTLPYVTEQGYSSLLKEHGGAVERGVTDDSNITIAVNDLLLKVRDGLTDVRMSENGMAGYNKLEDYISMPSAENYPSPEEHAHDALMQVMAATGYPQRLDRVGLMRRAYKMTGEDAAKTELLVKEIATGARMLEMGIPASLSQSNMKMIDYWQRELRENPSLIEIVEKEVNSAVTMLHRVEAGEKIEKRPTHVDKQITELQESLPKSYNIAEEIRSIPDKDTREMVIVRDRRVMTADVVLPAGAAKDVDNEVPGMNKGRIEAALRKEGFETVSFYNPDGKYGYRPDDGMFEGKEISVSRLNNWKLMDVAAIDASEAVKKAGNMEFDQVLILKDDDNKYVLYMKPHDGDAVSIYPEKDDVNLFFDSIRQGDKESIQKVRHAMANKYYQMVKQDPSLCVNLFTSNATDEELAKINRSFIFRKKEADGKPGRLLCVVHIEGMDNIPAREVTLDQWQRLWLAEDKKAYKNHLAATIFADVLKADVRKETKEENTEKEEERTLSPGYHRFLELKEKHPDAILLFRGIDFYESFCQDAEKISRILGITLNRNINYKDEKGQPLATADFPYHALDEFLPRLIRAGQRVAICDSIIQRRESAPAQGIDGETASNEHKMEDKDQPGLEAEGRGSHR